MTFDELCQKSIEILKQTNTRRSANALFDVFYQMWAEGGFDGYGLAEKVTENNVEFGQFFADHGNREVADMTKTWYKETFGARKQTQEVKMTTVSVGGLLEETEKAYGFDGGKIYRQGQPVVIWVPKSQVTYNEKNQTLEMPVWLAKEKNYMQCR